MFSFAFVVHGQTDTTKLKEGFIIEQKDDEGKKLDDVEKAYTSADSAADESNISEDMQLSEIREDFVIKSFEIKKGLQDLIKKGKFDKKLADDVSAQFDEMMKVFEGLKDKIFNDEINKIQLVWDDFEHYRQMPEGAEKTEALKNIFAMWDETNIDVTRNFNIKFGTGKNPDEK